VTQWVVGDTVIQRVTVEDFSDSFSSATVTRTRTWPWRRIRCLAAVVMLNEKGCGPVLGDVHCGGVHRNATAAARAGRAVVVAP
jgi:hypothetical protein